MEAVAEAFRFELNTIVEATRLFNLFHEHGRILEGEATRSLRLLRLGSPLSMQIPGSSLQIVQGSS